MGTESDREGEPQTASWDEGQEARRLELLHLYMSLQREQRDALFAGTARAARITGVARRTVQFWVESGYIEAIVIGRKYKISLESLRLFMRSRQSDDR